MTNYHSHTTWCDGRDTPETMVRAAIAKGFSAFGFSSHAEFPERRDWTLDPARARDYVAEIRALGEKYADKIRIFCALEADYIRGVTTPDRARYAHLGLDYLIGSVHYAPAPDGAFVEVDHTPQILADGIRDHFGGDVRALITSYHAALREMVATCDFDIVGHPDLYRKYNAKHPYFDENAPWYRALVAETAEALAASGKVVEVNTGGIGRGWLEDAYPAAFFRDALRARGVRFVLDSDCHAADQIDAGFDRFAAAEAYVDFPFGNVP